MQHFVENIRYIQYAGLDNLAGFYLALHLKLRWLIFLENILGCLQGKHSKCSYRLNISLWGKRGQQNETKTTMCVFFFLWKLMGCSQTHAFALISSNGILKWTFQPNWHWRGEPTLCGSSIAMQLGSIVMFLSSRNRNGRRKSEIIEHMSSWFGEHSHSKLNLPRLLVDDIYPHWLRMRAKHF